MGQIIQSGVIKALFEENAALKNEIEDSRRKRRQENLLEENRALKNELEATRRGKSTVEATLEEVRQELEIANKTIGSSGGPSDVGQIVTLLRNLNSDVDDLAFQLSHGVFPEAAVLRTVTKAGLEGLGNTYHGGSRIISFINTALQRRVIVGDFTHPFICYAMCERLLYLVFQPFVPGQDKPASDIFHTIYTMIHQKEPQERSARWRAVTYLHAHSHRNDKEFCEKATDQFLLQMKEALSPLLLPEVITLEELKTNVGNTVKGIFESAIKLQDKASKEYFLWDFAPFMLPPDETFDPMNIETKQESGKVLLTVGLGMQAWRSIVKGDGAIGKDVYLAVKPKMISGAWNP